MPSMLAVIIIIIKRWELNSTEPNNVEKKCIIPPVNFLLYDFRNFIFFKKVLLVTWKTWKLKFISGVLSFVQAYCFLNYFIRHYPHLIFCTHGERKPVEPLYAYLSYKEKGRNTKVMRGKQGQAQRK